MSECADSYEDYRSFIIKICNALLDKFLCRRNCHFVFLFRLTVVQLFPCESDLCTLLERRRRLDAIFRSRWRLTSFILTFSITSLFDALRI